MIYYTIGIMLGKDLNGEFNDVLLITKDHPDWQKGKLNFPGGHVEVDKHESAINCIIREFKEETNLNTTKENWKEIGLIINEDNYQVDIFTCIYNEDKHGIAESITSEKISWEFIEDIINGLDNRFIISNLRFLIPLAINYFENNSPDQLVYSEFHYSNK